MKRKMNNKGFTLIELIVTILILAVIMTVTISASINLYNASKEKSENSFIKELTVAIEDYITLDGLSLNYTPAGTKNKCGIKGNATTCSTVSFYKATNSPAFDIIADAVLNEKMINPATEVECNSSNLSVEIYRDEEYVYCFIAKKKGSGTSCISSTVDTCSKIYG